MPANYSLFETHKADIQKLMRIIPAEYHSMALKINSKKEWFDLNIVKDVENKSPLVDLPELAETVPVFLKKPFLKISITRVLKDLHEFCNNYSSVSSSSVNNKKLADFTAMTLMLYISLVYHVYWAYFNGVRNLLTNGWDSQKIKQIKELFDLVGVDKIVWNNIRLLDDISELEYNTILNSGKVIDQADYMYVMSLAKRIMVSEIK